MIRISPLLLTLLLTTALQTVSAHELYNHNGTVLNADLEALFGLFHSDESFNQAGNRQPGSSAWREGYVKYGVSASQALTDRGTAYGAFSLLSSATWGDGDAAGLSLGDERRTAVEDAYLGWRSGNLFPALGEDGIDVSGGRQVVTLGDGFLIQGDPVNLGKVDLGANFNRGGAYYLAARKAFDRTGVLRLGGSQGWRGDLMWLKSDNHYQADTSLAVGNLEHVGEAGTVGLSWIRGLDVDQRYARIMGLEHRDGMDTYSLRGRGSLGVKDLEVAAEYVTQDRTGGHEDAWYLEGNWTFSSLPWSPTATYRYSRFSADFDPLFFGMSRGYGTWFQGEVAANYAGPFNSNTQVHHVGLKAKPRDNLTLGALYFDFDTLDTEQGNFGGREVDLYLEWMVNDHLLISPLVGFYTPERSADNGGVQLGGRDTGTYLQVVVGTFF
ncbi:alginate export family protein [Pseudomonas sp. p1(2021b)]|uniref:alginate export family protein n=1 Tax=Pseudomonas sp. p1(2021b) TaxID=2874628 RepID=UPI001CCA71B2|nr:alginate export family protein [Pseudomonas sp. p1(2021b)]UBM27541.1 alginate export family protein [Pseudomonas sp. p1(2021b)]